MNMTDSVSGTFLFQPEWQGAVPQITSSVHSIVLATHTCMHSSCRDKGEPSRNTYSLPTWPVPNNEYMHFIAVTTWDNIQILLHAVNSQQGHINSSMYLLTHKLACHLKYYGKI